MPVLDVQHIEKHFGSTRVLEDISFSLDQGQALAIIGSSGSGKTTLLRCLNFLETPNAGRIIVNGETLFDAADHSSKSDEEIRKRRLHFGMVFQSFNLFPQYTALENVMLASLLLAKERPDYKQHKREINEQIEHHAIELLSQMSLEGRMSHYPHQLSGGQQQRVAIGRALITRPALILADEPTGNLDTQNSSEVIALLKQASRSYEQTIILITHSRSIAQTADRILRVSDGVLTDFGRCRE